MLHGCLFDKQGVTTLDHLAKNPCKDHLLECLASESCNKCLDRYDNFKETVRRGALDSSVLVELNGKGRPDSTVPSSD